MTATTASAATQRSLDPSAPDPFIGPCPPWCRELETGHRVAVGADDRKHVGAYLTIVLALMDMHITRPPGGLVLEPQTIDVQLERRDRDAEPRIALTLNDQTDLTLSLDEARALRDALSERLDAAAATEVAR